MIVQSKPLNESEWHFPEPFTHRVDAFGNLDCETLYAHSFQRQQDLEQQRSINGMSVWFEPTHHLNRDVQISQMIEGGKHLAGLFPRTAVVWELPKVRRETWR
jgi:hypothetical protein